MKKNRYIVMSAKKELSFLVMGIERNIKMSWAKGMVGALPVFSNKKDAELYAEGVEIIIGKG